MANFKLAPGEKFVQCPYEKSHQVTEERLRTHLVKCRANHETDCRNKGIAVQIGICRYNHSHQMNKLELIWHEEYCENRYNIIPHIQYHQSDEFKAKLAAERSSGAVSQITDKLNTMTINSLPANDDGENWDADARDGYVAGYDPKQKLASSACFYMPPGLKPAERKAYRKENIRKAREQSEREDIEKYGPRIGSAEQPPLRQVGTSTSVPATSKSAPATNSVTLPVGLTFADVMTVQAGQGGGKNKKKKKKGQVKVDEGAVESATQASASQELTQRSESAKGQEQEREEVEFHDYDWNG